MVVVVVHWILMVVVEHLIVEVEHLNVEVEHHYEMVLGEDQVYYQPEEWALSWKAIKRVLRSCLVVEVLDHLMVWEV